MCQDFKSSFFKRPWNCSSVGASKMGVKQSNTSPLSTRRTWKMPQEVEIKSLKLQIATTKSYQKSSRQEWFFRNRRCKLWGLFFSDLHSVGTRTQSQHVVALGSTDVGDVSRPVEGFPHNFLGRFPHHDRPDLITLYRKSGGCCFVFGIPM